MKAPDPELREAAAQFAKIPLSEGAKIFGVSLPTFCRLLHEAGIPIWRPTERIKSVRLLDLFALEKMHERPAVETTEGIAA